jgi:hypothetical protein
VKKERDEGALREVETKLEEFYNSHGFGFLLKESKVEVNSLEKKKRENCYLTRK